MLQNKTVHLEFEDEPNERVECIVQYNLDGSENFADSLRYVIRMDRNADVLQTLSDIQIADIEQQIENPQSFFPKQEESEDE